MLVLLVAAWQKEAKEVFFSGKLPDQLRKYRKLEQIHCELG